MFFEFCINCNRRKPPIFLHMNLSVSVIIPAYNAAATIAQTITSLLSQSFKGWEAIIVDDGCMDETVNIVKQYTATDARLRLVSQPNKGLAAARNTGIQHARFDWLLFLDADDWVSEKFLESMTAALAANTEMDAVHCGWSTVAPDGYIMDKKYAVADVDMFPSFVRTCAFVVHSCIIRKSLVIAADGFDASFKVCQDWDFWQRICRAGTRFAALREVHAYYRMKPDSLSKKVKESLINSLKIIDQGHSFDARVLNPVTKYINGFKTGDVDSKKLYCATWFAGLYIGQGEDARPMLDLLNKQITAQLNADTIADYIFEAVCFYTCKQPGEWINLWHKNNRQVKDYLRALGQLSQTNGLLGNTLIAMERLILKHATIISPLIFETSYALNVELTEPVATVYPTGITERIIIKVKMEGAFLGIIELPAANKPVESPEIKECIAKNFAWQILKRFFEYTVYKQPLSMAANEKEYGLLSEKLHNETGWLEFLRQLWGRYTWAMDDFYNPSLPEVKMEKSITGPCLASVEISGPLRDIKTGSKNAIIKVTIAGIIFGYINLPVTNKTINAQTILAAITNTAGFGLCIACVREALIGMPLNEPSSIQSRLKKLIY